VLAQLLEVLDQVRRGVGLEQPGRTALAAAALVVEHGAVVRGVEEAALGGHAAATGPAVQVDHRLAVGPAGFLEIEFVAVADGKPLRAMCRGSRIQDVLRVAQDGFSSSRKP